MQETALGLASPAIAAANAAGPIPTASLVDAQGSVRWIDQSTDHQVRSDPERARRIARGALRMKTRSTLGR